MATVFKTIEDRVVTVLQTGTPQSATVYDTRETIVPEGKTPALAIYFTGIQEDVGLTPIGQIIAWNLGVQVEVLLHGVTPRALADPFMEFIHDSLVADSYLIAGLGGLITHIEHGPYSYQTDEADPLSGLLTMIFGLHTRTNRLDLSDLEL